jgi:hypothetical protein
MSNAHYPIFYSIDTRARNAEPSSFKIHLKTTMSHVHVAVHCRSIGSHERGSGESLRGGTSTVQSRVWTGCWDGLLRFNGLLHAVKARSHSVALRGR